MMNCRGNWVGISPRHGLDESCRFSLSVFWLTRYIQQTCAIHIRIKLSVFFLKVFALTASIPVRFATTCMSQSMTTLCRIDTHLPFNQSLERVTLPSSLQSLVTLPFQPKPASMWACHLFFKLWVLAGNSTKACEHVTLSSSLQSMSFGENFNQSLEQRVFKAWVLAGHPTKAWTESSSLSSGFSQSLERVTLPLRLQSLSLGWNFNQSRARDLKTLFFPESVWAQGSSNSGGL